MDTNTTTTTVQQIVQEASFAADPFFFILGVGVAVIFGMYLGFVASRPSIPRSRVRLRALRAYQDMPAATDPLVASLLRREIRSIEIRLGEDKDED